MGIKKKLLLLALVVCVSLIPAAVNAEPFAEAEIPVSCKVSPRVPEKYRDFTYTLTAESEDCPMPEGTEKGIKTVHMRKTGKIDFGKICFDHPEMYSYTIRETTPDRGRFRRDRNVYKVSLMADTTGRIRVAIKNGNGEKQERIVFRNTYQKDPKRYRSPKMGDDESAAIWLFVLLAGAGAAVVLIKDLERVRNKREWR